ncbi:hypothetical protein EH165_02295 [Nakamurella antarctica]|uniref:Uncharacterized protein n=1 Tax=Nakamurella antarctica TaxID=1902245 RepID=A0A3G8ZID7_9ACTN|nr:hypothetical protein [Nakamurella antarctica]AZI57162.1 hypothetical protein EH165_02295 [Nakamurella antarctica]
MAQLSFYSADVNEPQLVDLGGILAAHGQVVVHGSSARLSILVADRWRATALQEECTVRGVAAKVIEVEGPAPFLLQTEKEPQLAGLASAWTRGAVKSVPDGLIADPGLLRCWAISAGRTFSPGYILGLDPHAPDTHDGLSTACAKAGLAGSLIGVRGGGPGVRIVGHRRLVRLVEYLGQPPEGARDADFPVADY